MEINAVGRGIAGIGVGRHLAQLHLQRHWSRAAFDGDDAGVIDDAAFMQTGARLQLGAGQWLAGSVLQGKARRLIAGAARRLGFGMER